jgi:hypothetical protein
MGQTVYVLMANEGGKKGENWRPVAVVTNPEVAEQWYQYGTDVDWVPLGLDEVRDIQPDKLPSFQPRKLEPGEERAKALNDKLQATITRMQKVIDDQQAMIKKLQKGKGFKASLLQKGAMMEVDHGEDDANGG